MPRPRQLRPGRPVVACWALFVATGIGFVLPDRTNTATGLSPATLTTYLRQVAGPDAHDIRVNGVYGSGHFGAWQFVAHLTWREGNDIRGGVTELPQRAGQPALTSQFSPERLIQEQQASWPLHQLEQSLPDDASLNDALAMIELTVPLAGGASLVACHAREPRAADCREQIADGRVTTNRDVLTDDPSLGALSVQRVSAPVTT